MKELFTSGRAAAVIDGPWLAADLGTSLPCAFPRRAAAAPRGERADRCGRCSPWRRCSRRTKARRVRSRSRSRAGSGGPRRASFAPSRSDSRSSRAPRSGTIPRSPDSRTSGLSPRPPRTPSRCPPRAGCKRRGSRRTRRSARCSAATRSRWPALTEAKKACWEDATRPLPRSSVLAAAARRALGRRSLPLPSPSSQES